MGLCILSLGLCNPPKIFDSYTGLGGTRMEQHRWSQKAILLDVYNRKFCRLQHILSTILCAGFVLELNFYSLVVHNIFRVPGL